MFGFEFHSYFFANVLAYYFEENKAAKQLKGIPGSTC